MHLADQKKILYIVKERTVQTLISMKFGLLHKYLVCVRSITHKLLQGQGQFRPLAIWSIHSTAWLRYTRRLEGRNLFQSPVPRCLHQSNQTCGVQIKIICIDLLETAKRILVVQMKSWQDGCLMPGAVKGVSTRVVDWGLDPRNPSTSASNFEGFGGRG